MRLVDHAEQRTLLERYQKHEPRLVSGGSVANSIIAFSQLGGQAAFIGCVGDDRYGLFYANEFEELGIDIGNPIIVNEATGTCVCIITPDAERTMRTCLAVSSHLAARHVDEERIKNSEWLFIEGYVFANPETGQTAIREAIQLAKAARHQGRDHLLRCVRRQGLRRRPSTTRCKHADLFFCNETRSLRRHRRQRAPRKRSTKLNGQRPLGGRDQRPARRLRPPRTASRRTCPHFRASRRT